jgi:hypothetical protein
LQTDKAAYLLRQYFFSNLHDRLSTRPFLSQIAKKWLAFQVRSLFLSHFPSLCWMVINIHKRTEVDPAGDCMKSYILSSSAYSVPDWWLSFSRVNTYYLKKALILVARVRVILFFISRDGCRLRSFGCAVNPCCGAEP